MNPRARNAHLVVQVLPTETLVFDQRTSKAHCLNRITALVWRHCDGRTDLAALARLVERELSTAGGALIVQLALEQLASRHLLEGTVERGSPAQRRSRRELLQQLAASAAALPVILTVAAPRAIAAGSKPTPPPPPFCSTRPDLTSCGSPGQQCCQGACVTPGPFNTPCTADCQCIRRCSSGTCTCFPAGTLVAVQTGFRPIESIQPNEPLWAFDPTTSERVLRRAVRKYEYDFEGNLVDLRVAGETIETTDNHPFWVVAGEGLEDRAKPERLPTTPEASRTPGRWVEAGDLRLSDMLLLEGRRQAAVDRLATRSARQKVYNIRVEELHTYTVGINQLLVHNK